MILWLGIWLLFLVGLRLSYFFSGIETAFYRASKLRLNIDAQTGDVLSRRILNFAANPSQFVATILIGNNIANYVTTYAVSCGAIQALGSLSELKEVAVTVLISPVVFVFGELLPKSLHYQAPLLMLKRYFHFFWIAHLLLLPFSWPLMLFTGLLQKLGGVQRQPMLRILGRRPLARGGGRHADAARPHPGSLPERQPEARQSGDSPRGGLYHDQTADAGSVTRTCAGIRPGGSGRNGRIRRTKAPQLLPCL